jgi:hypothetical protein
MLKKEKGKTSKPAKTAAVTAPKSETKLAELQGIRERKTVIMQETKP